MRFDDRKLRAQVREETLREVAEWLREQAALHRAASEDAMGSDRALYATCGAAADVLEDSADGVLEFNLPAPTEDDGFTTVRSEGRWWNEANWPGVDGGID